MSTSEEHRFTLLAGHVTSLLVAHRAVEDRIEEGARPSVLPLTFSRRYAQPLCAQLGHLLVRNVRCYWRTPDYNATRMAISLGVALIFGSMYWMRATRRCSQRSSLSTLLILITIFFCFPDKTQRCVCRPAACNCSKSHPLSD
jgi:hypothetical protein